MIFIAVRRWRIVMAAMFSIAAVVLNMLTLQYLHADNLGIVDMSSLTGKKIMLDPGHGGIDDGASGNGLIEKDLNLTIARRLRDVLQAHGAEVMMIRDSDIDFYTRGKGGKRNDLMRRVEMINTPGADVFVSIHADAIKATVRPGAGVLYGATTGSKELAEILQLALKDCPQGNKRQAKQDKGIIVLNASTIPGALIETGFLSESADAANLRDSAYQQAMAERLAKGLAYHFSHNVGR